MGYVHVFLIVILCCDCIILQMHYYWKKKKMQTFLIDHTLFQSFLVILDVDH